MRSSNGSGQFPRPTASGDIVSLGLVSDIFIANGKVMFSITVPAERARDLEPIRARGRSGGADDARRRPAPWSC